MRPIRAACSAVAVLSVLTALLSPAAAHADARHAAPGDTVILPVRDALAALPIQSENRTGYELSKFRHWTDADHDGCNTRAEVLKSEAVVAPAQGHNCVLTGGRWYSPCDDRYLDRSSTLDVDHLVPLAEAWDSGASNGLQKSGSCTRTTWTTPVT